MCHSLALAVLVLAVLELGCASRAGWSVSSARTCERKAPPRVCVVAEPDYGHVLAVADIELLPGECAVAGVDGHGGLLRVATRDPDGDRRARWVSAPRGRFTVVRVDEDGRVAVEHERCDQSPL